MQPLGPWLGILVPSAVMLLVGFVAMRAAGRWPEATSLVMFVGILAALVALAIAAYVVDADHAVYWLVTGIALLVLALPAGIPLTAARRRVGVTVTWAGIVDCLRLVLAVVIDPFPDHRPTERAREVGRLAGTLFSYAASCWILMIAISVFAHLTGRPGSFR